MHYLDFKESAEGDQGQSDRANQYRPHSSDLVSQSKACFTSRHIDCRMPEIRNIGIVGVVGAGTMGAGIAQLSAAAGCDVYLFDLREGAAEKQKQGIAQQLGKRVTDGKLPRAACAE